MGKEKINLRTTGEYPCQWDDLIDEHGKTYATVYTLKNARGDGVTEAGITQSSDGIFDIVIDAPKLTKDVVRNSLKELSKITGIEYKFNSCHKHFES